MKELYETGDALTTSKKSSIRNIKEGSVKIDNTDIKLNLIYTKREKVFENNR